MSLTRSLTRLIETKPVSDDDLAAAALFVLDTLANALAARHSPQGQILRDWHARRPSDTGRRAFLFGALAHILEMDDLHRESVTHPGCVVVPAAWAMAAQVGSGGRDFLKSVLAGYEAVLPHRQRRRPRALPGVAQHGDLRPLRRRDGHSEAARPARGTDRVGAR